MYWFVLSTCNQRVMGLNPTQCIYTPRQGILSTFVPLDPGVVNEYPAGLYFFNALSAKSSCMGANAMVIMH